MSTPSWININFFLTSLRKYFNEDVQVLGFSCKPAVPAGENYTTDVFRANVTYTKNENMKQKENILLIVKTTRQGFLNELDKDMNLFFKEIDMFTKVLPKLDETYGKKNAFAANCIHAVLEPTPVIVIEDMCPLGYSVHERRGGLDEKHVLQVLKKIAAFHATSLLMVKKDPSILGDMYAFGLYTNKELIINWVELGFKELTEAIKGCEGLNPCYKKLEKMSIGNLMKNSLNSWKKESRFKVLNHGDLWINNIMFRYDENAEIVNCRFIDFQLAVYASPVFDLHYFFSTSLSDSIRNKVNYFLDFYYVNLLTNLVHLKYDLDKAPTRYDIMNDFKEKALYGLIATTTVLPLVKAEGRNDASFEDLLSDDTEQGFRYHCYNNKIYKSAISHLLPYYNRLAALD